MMNIKFFKYIFILMFCNFLFSKEYNITGYTFDVDTKKPIKNINVYIDNKDIGTTTDKDGYFNLSLKNFSDKKINLNIQIIGYESKVIKIDLTKNWIDLDKIYLKNQLIELAPVQIHSHANKSSQISDVVVEGKDLNENLKGTLATTLSNHPNIGINSFGVVTSKPALRGFSGDRFLLTKEGTETGDLSQSSIDHVITLDMSEVNQIEIIRGPRSLIYGPNAIGGVINTTLAGNPKTRVDKFSTKMTLGSEQFTKNDLILHSFGPTYNQGLFGNLLFYIPFNNNQINLSINNRTYGNQTSPIGILENTNSFTENYKVGVTHYNIDNYVNFNFEKFIMNYGIPPTPSGHTTGIDIPLYKNSLEFNYHKDISIINFTELNVKLSYIDYQHSEVIPGQGSFHVSLAKKTQNLKIEFSAENLLIGFKRSFKKFIPDGFYLTPITKEYDLSLYGFYETKTRIENLDFLGSFRLGYHSINPDQYDYNDPNANLITYDNFGNIIGLVKDRKFENISFSFGIRKQMDEFQFNSWLMHTMRSPRVEELYSDGPHLATYAFEIGNPNLKAEKIYGMENSISYNSNLLDFSLVTFYNYSPYYFQMTKDGICDDAWQWDPNSGLGHPCPGVDWIDWGSAPLGWLYEYSAKGNEVVIKGFEIDLGYDFGNFELQYNLSYVHGDNKTLKMPLSYIHPMKEILEFNFNKKSMDYKLRFSKIHKQNRLGEFETYTPGVNLTDFIVSYSYMSHSITMQINNIFNEVHYNHLSRIKNITPELGTNIHFIYKVFI
ncbi:MAG: hypothetical protein CMG09_07475 [Candidatus Marinimicrobia bacterium]|nr:hypothetical protein [Candidatus Neomarinimicrobiota bacterium]